MIRPLFALLLLAVPGRAAVVEEYTRLFPVKVERIETPRSVEEVSRLVRESTGPVSIGGGHYSMGGQTAAEGTVHLDMRRMDRVLAFSPEDRTITVEAGITWRKLLERVDPAGLSPKIMQSYANFTVGGSLSVNCHGRYVEKGPIISSVRSIQFVLADGRIVEASPASNAELFYGAIGGYGGLGVITAATLELEADEPLERTARLMPVSEYPAYYRDEIAGSTTAVFHNADVYPPDYARAAAVTFSRTSRAVTVPARLQPPRSYAFDVWLQEWVSERGYAKRLRERAIDPIRLKARPVAWRNHEASLDVAELEPRSRAKSTYVLQEYFVPDDRFGAFMARMTGVLRRRRANVLNISIRHARKDPGSLLAWAPGDRFAFVLFYKQGVSGTERAAVEGWTRELIDAALAAGGAYYLPYQIVATDAQFHAAYPGAGAFFALKKKLDPSYKFRNKLWDRYLPAYP
jgi:FAD/FMN-containing dehydrogenase